MEEEEEESEEEEEPSYEGLDEVSKLKQQILFQRKKRFKTNKELESSKNAVNKAKSTISLLIGQITDYKTELEREKSDLEAEIAEALENIEKEGVLTASMKQSIEQLEEEKRKLMEQINKLEQEHEEALEEENKRKSEMKKETVENLQTLMDELQRIEEANELLKKQQEIANKQIEEERAAHSATLQELIKEKQKIEDTKTAIETLKLTNEALIGQLKQSKRATLAMKPEATTPKGSFLEVKQDSQGGGSRRGSIAGPSTPLSSSGEKKGIPI